ncbi:hypothetical protein LCGC14_2367900 [marine sediment metagenome]|uniref:Uncharacterized protein n=1 Tax=marine sediment metagenome TaxID=412755 RepID=A0A0F9CRX0_9ZZZZ
MLGWLVRIAHVVAIKPRPVFQTSWVQVPAQDAALDDGDATGIVFQFLVPISGTLQSASVLDTADQGNQLDVELCSGRFAGAAADAQFKLTDVEARYHIYRLQFATYADHEDNQTSDLENIGKAYKVPPFEEDSKWGWMWGQGIASGTPTYAAGSKPYLRVEIYPDE